MNLTEISFGKVKSEIESYLRTEYSKSNVLFSNASPYGQILSVVENLYQLSILYMKNSIKQFDLLNPLSINSRAIRNAAIFAGHIPARSVSATGTLKFTVKSSVDLTEELPGGRLTFKNRQSIKNKTNGLEYAMNLGTETVSLKIETSTVFYIPIIQGKWDFRNFTGTGEMNQTYQVKVRGNQKEVENFNYEVLVNGEFWTIKKHLYDLLPDEKSCVVRTGFEGGIDVIFGNGGFGLPPSIGSIIEISYLISDGANGSIFRRTLNDWTFIDQAQDANNGTVDPSNLFDVAIYNDINFGADKENINFTKNILPIVSNNFVLGLPQQYAYQIKKLGVFSHVNAYERFGTIFIVCTPNIRLFKNQNADYFSIDVRSFDLDDYEKSKINKYLRTGGNIQLSRKYRVVSPVLSYYIINVFILTYSDAKDENVNSQIQDKISEYFLDLKRIDRVPKSDLVQVLSIIGDIHSVDVSFLSRKNEEFHRQSRTNELNRRLAAQTQDSNITNMSIDDYPERNTVLGLDPVLGDILFEPNEVPIIRGGWYDRKNFYYSDDLADGGLKTINIIRKGTVDSSKRQKV
jgi:hypothetical protein